MTRILFAMAMVGAMASVARGGAIGRVDPQTLRTPTYVIENGAFVRHNGERFNNRPLYCNQMAAVVVAGDRPLVRFGHGATLDGTFMAALVRGQNAKWLHEFSDITARYRADHMEWALKDAAFGDTVLTLDAVPPAQGAGMALRLRVENAQPGDQLIWAFGGTAAQKVSVLNDWDVTTARNEKTMAIGFLPDDCRGDRVTADAGHIVVRFAGKKSNNLVIACCTAGARIVIGDADQWRQPLKLLGSSSKEKPLACGAIDLDGQKEIHWAMASVRNEKDGGLATSPARFFAAGMKRAEELENRVVVHTPDARFDAMVSASNAVTDGVFRDGIYCHAGMRWGVPLLGWRCMFGGTVYGWHDRVLTEARLCLAKQITTSDKTAPLADVKYGLSCQSIQSRLFGKGRVDAYHPWHYDMQTQFFDQLIHAWRWTGDAELEKLLRPALELHLEYIRECFDPNDTGLYESYANTWPTDDQWYNGGGTAEETAYAYAGHKAAMELARRAGDHEAVKRHELRLAKIQQAFMSKLWIASKGYVGAYVEQGGHERLHEDCWLYAIFCPIDAGMLSLSQAASSLYYTEWGLEREKMPYGGERCWPSNWVPSLWSLREMWPGDEYHLALAYFQTGLADDGWQLVRGTFPQMACFGRVPGDLGYPNGATDFNDCASMFCRTVVEGLFGYRPDYPNGVVTIAPQLPSDWDRASIKTPDVSLDLQRTKYRIELTVPAAMELRIPVRARSLKQVTVDGEPAKWEMLPGFGCGIAKILLSKRKTAAVELICEGALPQYAAESVQMTVGGAPELSPKDATRVIQPAVAPTAAGYHLAEAVVQVGDVPQRRLFKIKVDDPRADAAMAARSLEKPPANARWECVDLSRQLNGDIRKIFQQQYSSPRANTCSLRLNWNGYSTWQMSLSADAKPPAIDLTGVSGLLDSSSRLSTPAGAPFAWPAGERNIAFTSMWDNWPREVVVPVNRKADAIWLLVCGFTNPMQGRIANAEVRMKYADGVVEKLELIPPLNFWSLCPFGGVDYDYQRDGFCLPKIPPATVQLGKNCRAIVLNQRLRPDAALESVTIETLSQEVIIGVMGMTLMNPN